MKKLVDVMLIRKMVQHDLCRLTSGVSSLNTKVRLLT